MSLVAGLMLAACTAVTPGPASPGPGQSPGPAQLQPTAPITRLAYGTDYGECGGYCHRELQISAESMNLLESAYVEKNRYPDRRISQPTPAATWQKLTGLADVKVFAALPERIGCPDCADGGAEWVEIGQGSRSKRVTFEPPAGLPQQAALLTELRDQLQRLYSAGRFPIGVDAP